MEPAAITREKSLPRCVNTLSEKAHLSPVRMTGNDHIQRKLPQINRIILRVMAKQNAEFSVVRLA